MQQMRLSGVSYKQSSLNTQMRWHFLRFLDTSAASSQISGYSQKTSSNASVMKHWTTDYRQATVVQAYYFLYHILADSWYSDCVLAAINIMDQWESWVLPRSNHSEHLRSVSTTRVHGPSSRAEFTARELG